VRRTPVVVSRAQLTLQRPQGLTLTSRSERPSAAHATSISRHESSAQAAAPVTCVRHAHACHGRVCTARTFVWAGSAWLQRNAVSVSFSPSGRLGLPACGWLVGCKQDRRPLATGFHVARTPVPSRTPSLHGYCSLPLTSMLGRKRFMGRGSESLALRSSSEACGRPTPKRHHDMHARMDLPV
jgi:hypothetical protein